MCSIFMCLMHHIDQMVTASGNQFIVAKSDDVSKVIVEAIKNNYSGEVAAHTEPASEEEEKFY